MPTASQCLILMNDDEVGPRFSRRRYSGVSASVMPNIAKNPNTPRFYDHQVPQGRILPSLGIANQNQGMLNGQLSVSTINGINGESTGWKARTSMDLGINTESTHFQAKANLDLEITRGKMMESSASYESTESYQYDTTLFGTQEPLGHMPQPYGVNEESYDRYEDLGFRKRQNRRLSARTLDANDNQLLTGIIKDAKFVPSPPGTKPVPTAALQPSQLRVTGAGGDQTIYASKANGPRDESKTRSKTLSLLEEVKQKVGYESRVLPAMHMRKTMPESDPNAVCFSISNTEMWHKEIKEMVQMQTGYDVKSIQYDPVSVRAGSDISNRWIVRFECVEACKKLIKDGLEVNGENIIVRSLDQMQMFEYTAYLAKCEEEKATSLEKSRSVKRVADSRRRKASRRAL